jgi:hypothetical protein
VKFTDFRKDRNGWRWVPVEFILRHLTYSYDFGDVSGYPSREEFWATFIESKALDDGFMDMVDSLETYGWREALTIEYHSDYYGAGLHIRNGHHRLAAAILLCYDVVPLFDWQGKGKLRLKNCPDISTSFDDTFPENNLLVEVL